MGSTRPGFELLAGFGSAGSRIGGGSTAGTRQPPLDSPSKPPVLGEDSGITKELLPLLTSSHGTVFPSIPDILAGTQIKRELGGV